jgi:hypoxanthine phosphoribosyltransferase
MDTQDAASHLDEVLVTPEQIRARIAEIARQIEADYPDSTPLLVGVLKGAVMVMADLARELKIDLEMDWMAISSYGNDHKSSGVVKILKDLDTALEGRDVLIVEDIVDTGLTLSWLLGNFESRGARSIRVMTLLRKPDAMQVEVPLDYVGFDIPNAFVVGYGLDYANRFRNLTGVAVLKPEVYGAQAD